MHRSSYQLMRYFRDQYLTQIKEATILDVGSQDLKKNPPYYIYRDLFRLPFRYTGMDIVAGKNVDIVGYENIKGTYDVVISGQVMEHVRRPWEWLKSLTSYFTNYICIISVHTWPEHKYPIDTYRYFPDGMRDLFEYAGINVIEIKTSEVDTMGVGTK